MPGMPAECAIPDCTAAAVAKGLCGKHYMRIRRHGDPARTDKRGPKRTLKASSIFPRDAMGARSRRRYDRAVRIAEMLRDEFEIYPMESALKAAMRPNESLSVAKLLKIMEIEAAFALAKAESPAEDAPPE